MLGFIIAAIAGLLVPHLQEPVAKPVIGFLKAYIRIDADETRAIAFMIAVLVAAVLSSLVDSGTTFGVIFGAVLGYFGVRIYALLKRIIDARTDVE